MFINDKNQIGKLSRNIRLNYLFTGLINFNPVSALWVVYMASKGLDLWQIGIAEALLHITIFAMEIPTGMVADLFGRRISRTVGAFIWFSGEIVMILANSFTGFCAAFIISGLGITLESGAGDALVYDSLKELDKESSYKKIAGRAMLIINLCEAVAILMGGLLSDIRFLYAYILAAAFQLAAFVASLFFVEPGVSVRANRDQGAEQSCSKEQHSVESKIADGLKRARASFVGQFTSSLQVVRENRRVLFAIVLCGILDMSACLCYFYGRKVFEDMGWTQGSTGLLYMLYCLLGALTAVFIHRLDKKFGEKRVIFAICMLMTAGFGLFAFGGEGLAPFAFLGIGTVYGASYPLFSDYINREIPSENRATILSLNGAMFSFSMIVFFPLVGRLGDSVSLGGAFRIVFIPIAVILLLLGAITLKLRHGISGEKIRAADSAIAGKKEGTELT